MSSIKSDSISIDIKNAHLSLLLNNRGNFVEIGVFLTEKEIVDFWYWFVERFEQKKAILQDFYSFILSFYGIDVSTSKSAFLSF